MSLTAIIQIIYLAINLAGVAINLIWFISDTNSSIISDMYTFISKHFGNVAVVISSIFIIVLFLPTLAVMSAVLTFIMLVSTYSK
jgi:hypothetical protein